MPAFSTLATGMLTLNKIYLADAFELLSKEGLHTIQKPERLMERIILASSNEGELVLDPFCGTGTVPMAARRLGRHFIAFEKDPNMYKLALQRLQG